MRTALFLSSMLFVACGTATPMEGGSGGGTGTTPRCNTSNCAGCCDASDVCQLGQSATACGTGGNACLACGSGLTCSSGTCVAATGMGGGGGSTSTGPKRVFVTSGTYTGNLKTAGNAASGLAGGDALCNLAATAANLGGTWVAWLSSSTARAIDRVTGTGPWMVLGSSTVVFNNKANIATKPLTTIGVDENGRLTNNTVWTGTDNGGGASANTCSNWTFATDGYTYEGTYGDAANNTTNWTSYSYSDCRTPRSLLCFEL